MLQVIPRVKVGKSTSNHKKELFDFSMSNSTSFSFGNCQPIFCKQIEPQSHISIAAHNFVRFAAMHSPTFGNVSYRVYKQFVPTTELFEPYEDLKAGTPYQAGTNAGYVPEFEPSMRLCDISKFLIYQCPYSIYDIGTIYEDGSFDAVLLTFEQAKDVIDKAPVDNSRLNFLGHSCLDQQSSGGKYFLYMDGNNAITVEGADAIIYFVYNNKKYIVCYRYTPEKQEFFKALLGCGYQANFISTADVSVLPLFAYYKAYFDLFYVQRNSNWNNTPIARLMRYLATHPELVIMKPGYVDSGLFTLIVNSFSLICRCLYSADPDFVSSHTRQLAGNQPDYQKEYIHSVSNGGVTSEGSVSYDDDNTNTFINDNSVGISALSRVSLQLLNKLSVRVNKNTAFGRRLDLILKNLYGANYHHRFRTNTIGTQITHCQIGDVMSMSDTSANGTGAVLGEYAGKGIGKSDENATFDHFDTDTWGYVIVIGVIVPESGYCQGIDGDLYRISRDDQYQYDFDSVGFEATRQSQIFGDGSVAMPLLLHPDAPDTTFAEFDNTFGFIPRYTSKKVVQNRVNGLLALRSTRNTYLGYTLDRYLSPQDIVEGVEGSYKVSVGVVGNLVAGTAWRYLNSDHITSNFNRIFYNSVENPEDEPFTSLTQSLDNFLVHNVIQCKVNSPMLSISDSFDTDSFENDTMSVEKA